MHAPDSLFASPDMLPGWWGKLPGMGDFASRRLEGTRFVEEWDRWLQSCFGSLRQHESQWVEHYLASPVWLFALGGDIAEYSNWIGIIMPSVDSVGRYFPFTLASELTRAPVGAQLQNECALWWYRATHAALSALEEDMDASSFELALLSRFSTPVNGVSGANGASAESDEAMRNALSPDFVWPLQGECLWLSDPWGGQAQMRMRCFGLPRGERFATLFSAAAQNGHVVEGGA